MSYKSMEGPKVLEKFSVSTNISSLVKRTLMCLVAQLCLTLCDPMDCGPPGSSVHGILQARTLEWVAIPFSKGQKYKMKGGCGITTLHNQNSTANKQVDKLLICKLLFIKRVT